MLRRNLASSHDKIEIDPTNLTPQGKILFEKLLTTNGSPQLWIEKDFPYPCLSPSGIIEDYYFTHHVLWRACNPLGKHKGQARYEVISENSGIGAGAYGWVHNIEGTLAFENKEVIFKKKPRVVKIRTVKTPKELLKANAEYELCARTPHLHPKQVTFINNKGYLVMRKMPGMTLMEYINNGIKNIKSISIEQRLDCAIALVHALHTQVHAQHLVHRDIKPDNIMVLDDDGKMIINIIDFNLSKELKEDDDGDVGAPIYRAPEAWKNLSTTNKNDIYTMAVVIGQLFGVNIDSMHYWQSSSSSDSTQIKDLNKHKFRFYGLFQGIKGLNYIEKMWINKILKLMTLENAIDRPDADQLIVELALVKNEYQNRQKLVIELCSFIATTRMNLPRSTQDYISFFPGRPNGLAILMKKQISIVIKIIKLLRGESISLLDKKEIFCLRKGELGSIIARNKHIVALEDLLTQSRSAKIKPTI